MLARKLAPLVVAVAGATALAAWALTRPAPVELAVPATVPLALGRPVPAVEATGWLNVDDPSDRQVDGRVVLYDFWSAACANCARTKPWVRAWWDRYRGDGLLVLGVHTPQFSFERDRRNVEVSASTTGVVWPVALDSRAATASAFDNTIRPAFYVADRTGTLRHTRFGEGSYRATERVLRQLLSVPVSAPWADAPGDHDGVPDGHLTPGIHFGTERGAVAAGDGAVRYDRALDDLAEDEAGLSGLWLGQREFVEAAEPGAAVHLRYRAAEVQMVLASADGSPVSVTIAVDGGASETVTVSTPGLYRVALHPRPGPHTLTVTAPDAKVRVYSVSFGDRPVAT